MTWRRIRWSLALLSVAVEVALLVWQATRRKRTSGRSQARAGRVLRGLVACRLRVPDDRPEMAVRILDLARVDPPGSLPRATRQARTRRLGPSEHGIDLLAALDQVTQGP